MGILSYLFINYYYNLIKAHVMGCDNLPKYMDWVSFFPRFCGLGVSALLARSRPRCKMGSPRHVMPINSRI